MQLTDYVNKASFNYRTTPNIGGINHEHDYNDKNLQNSNDYWCSVHHDVIPIIQAYYDCLGITPRLFLCSYLITSDNYYKKSKL